jgi:tRNA threonylcarbamoyladenosine biosynthesis protein TsaB
MIGATMSKAYQTPKAFTVLGFDCAGRGCSAAVLRGGAVLARIAQDMERGQAERLMPLIAESLKAAGIEPGELDLIAVTSGPGGFTGIRIGLAAARGLALAAGIPAVGVSNFAVAAFAIPPAARAGRILVATIESKREEFYLQIFPPGSEPSGGALVHPRDLETFLPAGKLLITGDAVLRLLPWLKTRDAIPAPNPGPPDPADVARLGLALWQQGLGAPPRPLYLRPPDTSLPRAKKTPGVKTPV